MIALWTSVWCWCTRPLCSNPKKAPSLLKDPFTHFSSENRLVQHMSTAIETANLKAQMSPPAGVKGKVRRSPEPASYGDQSDLSGVLIFKQL